MRVTVDYNVAGSATIHVRDSLNNASIGELRRAVERAKREGHTPIVNLAELTLADRTSLQYLASLMRHGIVLEECPPYIECWVKKMLATPAEELRHSIHA
ncbi:MAG: hypothetical protein ABL995_10660 [Bryobacteraceae bacterium]